MMMENNTNNAQQPRLEDFVVENAKLIYRNFAGMETQYNRPGDRNFAVVIDHPEVAQQLSEDGWNVKIRPPREEGDAPFCYIPVTVKFFPEGDARARMNPKIVLISGNNRVNMAESMLNRLDPPFRIQQADLIIHPRFWEKNGNSGVKAYLKTLYITQEMDPLEAKYEDTDE